MCTATRTLLNATGAVGVPLVPNNVRPLVGENLVCATMTSVAHSQQREERKDGISYMPEDPK